MKRPGFSVPWGSNSALSRRITFIPDGSGHQTSSCRLIDAGHRSITVDPPENATISWTLARACAIRLSFDSTSLSHHSNLPPPNPTSATTPEQQSGVEARTERYHVGQ